MIGWYSFMVEGRDRGRQCVIPMWFSVFLMFSILSISFLTFRWTEKVKSSRKHQFWVLFGNTRFGVPWTHNVVLRNGVAYFDKHHTKRLFGGTILAREIIVVRFDQQFLFWPETYKSIIINNFVQFAPTA